jgi:hypothetical protein
MTKAAQHDRVPIEDGARRYVSPMMAARAVRPHNGVAGEPWRA